MSYKMRNINGSPILQGTEGLKSITRSHDYFARWVDNEPKKWEGSPELLTLQRAAARHTHADPEFHPELTQKQEKAFCISGLVVVEILNDTKQGELEHEGGQAKFDIWDFAHTQFFHKFKRVRLPQSIPSYEFDKSAEEAKTRHNEISDISDSLYKHFSNHQQLPCIGRSAVYGTGFVLNQWDMIWDHTVEIASDRELENFNPDFFTE